MLETYWPFVWGIHRLVDSPNKGQVKADPSKSKPRIAQKLFYISTIITSISKIAKRQSLQEPPLSQTGT